MVCPIPVSRAELHPQSAKGLPSSQLIEIVIDLSPDFRRRTFFLLRFFPDSGIYTYRRYAKSPLLCA
jgi:hypothetical protein